jgi:hypothetical protein
MPRPHQAIAAALLLGGCAVFQPSQTAEDFRREASAALLPRTGTLEVERPLHDVAATFAKNAPACLDGTTTATTKTITARREIIRTYVTTYKPRVVVGPERVELHVQWHTDGEIHVSPVPEGGAYRLVADAYSVGGGRTRLQWFDVTAGQDFLVDAIKGWATGQNLECPDLTTNW